MPSFTAIYSVFPFGETIVEHRGVNKTNINVSNETIVGEISIEPSVPGKVIVRFDGSCYATPGDRIVLAASNEPSWNVNDGAVGIEATSNDVNHKPFSHTRVYNVNAGTHTFYAIAHNYVEYEGDGTTSIYGSLTVRFIPDSDMDNTVSHIGINRTNTNVSTETVLGQVTIQPNTSGKVKVRFDGNCISTPGDRIVLAASNDPSWHVNDGSVSVEATNNDVNSNSFAHTRVYNVGPGSHTFYAVGHNYVEYDGDGIASVYGSLTVEFIQDESLQTIAFQPISQTNIDLGEEMVLKEITIAPSSSGKVIVNFDGKCISSPGDRIILAASDEPSWSINDGAVGLEATTTDINRNSFSHTRMYDVSPGNHTFYAVAHNYVEYEGDGTASIYGSLTVEFIPNEDLVSTYDLEEKEEYTFYPNPTTGAVNIHRPKTSTSLEENYLVISNSTGTMLETIKVDNLQLNASVLSDYPAGLYHIQLLDENRTVLHKASIVKAD